MKWFSFDLFKTNYSEYIEENKPSSIEGSLISVCLLIISFLLWLIIEINYLKSNKTSTYQEEKIFDFFHLKSVNKDYSNISTNNTSGLEFKESPFQIEFIKFSYSENTENAYQFNINNKFLESINLNTIKEMNNTETLINRASLEINLNKIILENGILKESNFLKANETFNNNQLKNLTFSNLKKLNENYNYYIKNKTLLSLDIINKENDEGFLFYNYNYYDFKSSEIVSNYKSVNISSTNLFNNLNLIITPIIIKRDNCIFTTCFKSEMTYSIKEEQQNFRNQNSSNTNLVVTLNRNYLLKIKTFVEFRTKLHTLILDFAFIIISLYYLMKILVSKLLKLNFYLELINKFINFSDLNEERRVKYFSNNNQITILKKERKG